MRASVLALVLAACASVSLGATGFAVSACGSSSSAGGDAGAGGTDPDGAAEGGSAGDLDGSGPDGGGPTDLDGAIPDDGAAPDGGGPAEVQLIGRFTASDGVGPSFAFPGSRVVARFSGTGATVKLSQTNVFAPAATPSYFNIIVDGVLQPAPLAVTGAGQSYVVAQGLPAALAHTIELEKRTEPNISVERFEGFTFAGGGALLSSPPRPTRRIEFLSDSTIDGFGIEGTRVDALAANYCVPGGTGAPPQLNNARKSMSAVTAATLGAEYFLVAYSGKGITKNESDTDPLFFPSLYDRALPDDPTKLWSRASWVPDAVVISVGGADFDQQVAEPAGFGAGYGGLVDKIRASYPSAYIVMTVWSQIKDDNIATRTAMTNSLQAIKSARPADTRLQVYAFPQANVNTDETGCQFHGNVTHHQNMAAQLVTKLKATIPGW